MYFVSTAIYNFKLVKIQLYNLALVGFTQSAKFTYSICADKLNKSVGKMTLYFGCRDARMANTYETEIAEALKNGSLSKVYRAFSRQPGQRKVIRKPLRNISIKAMLRTLDHIISRHSFND